MFIFTSPGCIQLFCTEAAPVSFPERALAAHRTEAWSQSTPRARLDEAAALAKPTEDPVPLASLLPSKHQAASRLCSQNHLKEPEKGHETSKNPQMASERTAGQPGKLALSGAAGVGRGHIKHASALSKYFVSEIHAAYLINPHHYFRGLTQALKLPPHHLTYTK